MTINIVMESLLEAGDDIFAKGSVKAILEMLTGSWLGLDISARKM